MRKQLQEQMQNFIELLKLQDRTLLELKEKLKWLSTHNKNYNNTQYFTILDCLECVEDLIGGLK